LIIGGSGRDAFEGMTLVSSDPTSPEPGTNHKQVLSFVPMLWRAAGIHSSQELYGWQDRFRELLETGVSIEGSEDIIRGL